VQERRERKIGTLVIDAKVRGKKTGGEYEPARVCMSEREQRERERERERERAEAV
jgi:hypothetical protein